MSIPHKIDWIKQHGELMNKPENTSDVQKQVDKEHQIQAKGSMPGHDIEGAVADGLIGAIDTAATLQTYLGAPTGIISMLDIYNINNSYKPVLLNVNIDSYRKAGGGVKPTRAQRLAEDSYDAFINAATYIDDILYGLPSGETIGTDYYKRIEKCEYVEEEEVITEDESYFDKKTKTMNKIKVPKMKNKPAPPWKYMFIRTKPKGNALYRMGLGDKKSKDSGLIFSILEDIIDLNPFRIGRMFKDTKDTKGEYKNCTTLPRNTHSKIKYYDQYNNELPLSDIPSGKTIEMFKNGDKASGNFSMCTTNKFILLVLIVLVLIILYKLLM